MQAGSVCNRPGVSSNFLAWLPAFAPHGKVLALQSGTRFVTTGQAAAAQLRSRRAVVAVTEGASACALDDGLLGHCDCGGAAVQGVGRQFPRFGSWSVASLQIY